MIPRKTPIKRSGRPARVNKKRKASEFKRCYHSPARVQFVGDMGCLACQNPQTEGKCDNAHVGNGGAGRKSDYTEIVPLCGARYSLNDNCHAHLHEVGREAFEDCCGIDLRAEAARIQTLWITRVEGTPQ